MAATTPTMSAIRSWARALSPVSSEVDTAVTARTVPSLARIGSTRSIARGRRPSSIRRTGPPVAAAVSISLTVGTGHGATSGIGSDAAMTALVRPQDDDRGVAAADLRDEGPAQPLR